MAKRKAADGNTDNQYANAIGQLKALNVQREKGYLVDEKVRQNLIDKIKLLKDEIRAREQIKQKISAATQLVEDHDDALRDVLESSEDILKASIATNKISSKTANLFAELGGLSGRIAVNLENQAFLSAKTVKTSKDSVDAMKTYSSSIADSLKSFKKGRIDAESLLSSIKSAGESLEDFIDDMDESTEEAKRLKNEMIGAYQATHQMHLAMGKGKAALQELGDGMRELSGELDSVVGGTSSMISALRALKSGGLVAGIFALGAAFYTMGKQLADAFGWKGALGMTQVQLEFEHKRRASIRDINVELEKQSIAAGKTVELSEKMKDQMAKMGVSAADVKNSSTFLVNNLGLVRKNAQELAGNMELMAVKTGVSSDQLGEVANLFRLTGNLSGKAAVDTLGIAENVAKAANIPISTMFQDLTDSSDLLLQNNYGNERSLIRQVATLRTMGVAASKVLQAGQNMVLNYKDSIRSEMELSALLGKRVDFSRARQLFYQGKADEAAVALRESLRGIDLDNLNQFQRQAIQAATGGMDLDTVLKLGKGGAGGALQTEQEKDKRSANAIADAVNKRGVTIAGTLGDAANAFFKADINAEQANRHAALIVKLDELKNNLGYILAAIVAAGVAGLAVRGIMNKGLPQMLGKFGPKLAGGISRTAAVAPTALMRAPKGGIDIAGKFYKGGQMLPKSVVSNVAGASAKTAGKVGVRGIAGGLGKGLLKGGVAGVIGATASMAGDYFGDRRMQKGFDEMDMAKINQGRTLKAAATALEYAGYGAMIGSIIPGVGTAVGAAVGGLVGGIKGTWDNFFSKDAKLQNEQIREAKLQQEMQERYERTTAEMATQQSAIALAAQSTEYFQASMLAQLIETTRLLDIIAFASTKSKGKDIYLDGKKVTRQMYNRSEAVYNVLADSNRKV